MREILLRILNLESPIHSSVGTHSSKLIGYLGCVWKVKSTCGPGLLESHLSWSLGRAHADGLGVSQEKLLRNLPAFFLFVELSYRIQGLVEVADASLVVRFKAPNGLYEEVILSLQLACLAGDLLKQVLEGLDLELVLSRGGLGHDALLLP